MLVVNANMPWHRCHDITWYVIFMAPYAVGIPRNGFSAKYRGTVAGVTFISVETWLKGGVESPSIVSVVNASGAGEYQGRPSWSGPLLTGIRIGTCFGHLCGTDAGGIDMGNKGVWLAMPVTRRFDLRFA